MNSKVEQFLDNISNWKEELKLLRTIILDCGFTEEFKWKQPCYTYQNKNIIILANFKHHCAIGFFKGAHLHDSANLLVKPGEHTQEGRQMRFTSIDDITRLEATIKAYLFEVIEIEKAGVKLQEQPPKVLLSEAIIDYFNENESLKLAFKQLTPGRQRAYNMFFSSAKQTNTQIARIKKYTERIKNGYGMNDCTCGLSKRMPSCDGSHKTIPN